MMVCYYKYWTTNLYIRILLFVKILQVIHVVLIKHQFYKNGIILTISIRTYLFPCLHVLIGCSISESTSNGRWYFIIIINSNNHCTVCL